MNPIMKERLNRILDLVSGLDPRDNTRWGHDTNCGDNDEILEEALAILEGRK